VFYFVPQMPMQIAGGTINYGDLLGLVWIVVNLGLYITILIRVSKALGQEEPLRPGSPSDKRDS